MKSRAKSTCLCYLIVGGKGRRSCVIPWIGVGSGEAPWRSAWVD